MNHDEAVTKHRLVAENSLDDGYWDDIYVEKSYYLNQDEPHVTPPRGEKGREVGEFDVLLVNYDDELAYYKELKTSMGDMYKAKEQLERAEDHFASTSWDVIGNRVLED